MFLPGTTFLLAKCVSLSGTIEETDSDWGQFTRTGLDTISIIIKEMQIYMLQDCYMFNAVRNKMNSSPMQFETERTGLQFH